MLNKVELGDILNINRLDGEVFTYHVTVKAICKKSFINEYDEQTDEIETVMIDGTKINLDENDSFEIIDVEDRAF